MLALLLKIIKDILSYTSFFSFDMLEWLTVTDLLYGKVRGN